MCLELDLLVGLLHSLLLAQFLGPELLVIFFMLSFSRRKHPIGKARLRRVCLKGKENSTRKMKMTTLRVLKVVEAVAVGAVAAKDLTRNKSLRKKRKL